ncbi:lipoprotein NlpI [Alteromonas oceanisediminis]|uniref:lipoprotein NlpI n=1 Tax=Alteromonas oceanisediminis TaxID=2836180 RepID=UPI001BDAC2D4|nr:lipoprotein NlpI [Alteromonas oceanisediminis]MBT0586509.1 lipoprotein NlpI [Alteromonas oceanisediminis]
MGFFILYDYILRSFPFSVVLIVLFLTGCSTLPTSQAPQMGNLLLAEPAPMNPRAQLAIARYNYILDQAEIDDTERAELLYQRGTLYDSVGLVGLAQYDFTQALQLKPDMAEAYNSIGVQYTQQMEFIQAYEAFDSSLEINPDYEFAFLNRGIALYYGGRPDLAKNDISTFLQQDQTDPYRAIWHYIVMREIDPEQAMTSLKAQRKALDESNWAVSVVDFYLGKISENALLTSLLDGVASQNELTDRLCEAYFYLGKYHSARGERGIASNYFKLALSTNVFEYVEHRYARLELERMRNLIPAANSEETQ